MVKIFHNIDILLCDLWIFFSKKNKQTLYCIALGPFKSILANRLLYEYICDIGLDHDWDEDIFNHNRSKPYNIQTR